MLPSKSFSCHCQRVDISDSCSSCQKDTRSIWLKEHQSLIHHSSHLQSLLWNHLIRMYTIHRTAGCTLYTVLQDVHYTLYCRMYTIHRTAGCTLYTILQDVHYTPYCRMYTIHRTAGCTLYTVLKDVHYTRYCRMYTDCQLYAIQCRCRV